MTDGIYTLPPPDHTNDKRVMVWLSPECAAAIDRWRTDKNINRTKAVDELIHLGLADDALYRRKRRHGL